MVRWVKDLTGKFPQRPHYAAAELDAECEEFITSFLKGRHGTARYPIDTDDLTVLIERETDALDLYADLSEEGEGIQGLTEFRIGGKPSVRVSKDLSLQGYRRNRLRTTLTHELGHVKFHNFLWALTPGKMTGKLLREASPRCRRGSILGASETDWMEWQAGYASGAFLMPRSALNTLVVQHRGVEAKFSPIFSETDAGQKLILVIQEEFDVSADAARVRLVKLDYMVDGQPTPSLFDVVPGP